MRRGIITLVISNIASKPLGLARQMLFAMFYGVTAVMSACRFAQTITLSFMNFFTTDTLNAGFLPLYQRYRKESPELAQAFFWYLFALLSLLSAIIFGLLYFGAFWIVHFFAPGFHGEVADQSVQFIQTFSYAVPFCLMGTLFSYLAMSGESYSGVGLRPIFESMGLIAGVVLSAIYSKVLLIAWAFVGAYFLFCCFVVCVCVRNKQLWWVERRAWAGHFNSMRSDFWRTIRPLLILPIFMQGKFVIEKLIASLMAVSVVASLDYARFIIETGINVIATPVGLVGLSAFSLLDGDKLAEKLETTVGLLLLIAIPATLFITINSKLIIGILYGYGAFDAYAIDQSSVIFSGMAVAFFAQIVGYVLIKVLSAKLQNHRVMYYLIAAILADLLFIVLTYRYLGPVALGIGESIYAFMVFILCVNYFKLFSLFREQLLFLVPVSSFYCVLAICLGQISSSSRWQAFFEQGLLFALTWSFAFLINKRTRKLFFEKVWSNE